MRTLIVVLAVLCFIPCWATEPGQPQDCMTDSDCDDSVDCTVDICNGGNCENTPDDSLCDNGQFCDGPETCGAAFVCSDDPTTTCHPTNPGNTCPDEGAGFCIESGFCSGDPTIPCEPTCNELRLGFCVRGNPCQAGSDPCPGQTCDEVNDVCSCGNGVLDAGEECDDGNNSDGDGCASDCTLEEPIPAASNRALLVLVLLLLTASTAVLRWRRRSEA